jgi:MFS transporter, DHA3 family, macrolide efflux protein
LDNGTPRRFLVIWSGQMVSGLGSGVSDFALGVWVYQETGSATRLAFVPLLVALTTILVSPLAGTVVDRWNRRTLIAACDFGSGLVALLLMVLHAAGALQVWQVYLALPFMVGLSVVQRLAFAASMSLLVPPRHLARLNGLQQAGAAGILIVSPLLAGITVEAVGLRGALLINFATFLVAVATLLAVRFPGKVAVAQAGEAGDPWWRSFWAGWSYVAARPGLLGLLVLFAVSNTVLGIAQVLLTPLILGIGSVAALGAVSSVGAAGMLGGGAILGVWGGPRRRVSAVLVLSALQGSLLFLGGLKPSLPLIGAALFAFMLLVPLIQGTSQTLWQTKIDLGLQGRVFALREVVFTVAMPVAFLVAGPLAERVFEPLLMPGGALAGSVGRVIGIGAGRGVGLLFMVLGAVIVAAVAVTALSPRVRRLEEELPDAVPPEPGAAAVRSHPEVQALLSPEA